MRVGILGGGQLALMLAEAGAKIGIDIHVFAASADDPAIGAAKTSVVGDIADPSILSQFVSGIDVVTYESDFLPFERMRGVSQSKFVPALGTIEVLSDKIRQKERAESVGLKVPTYNVFSGGLKDLPAWVDRIFETMTESVVFKWSRGGYDGKGVHIYSGKRAEAIQFLETGLARSSRLFAEQKISFKREVAQVSVFSTKGEWAHYPLVISEQRNGICRRAYGPANAFGVPEKLMLDAQKMAEAFGRAMNLYGTFALEMFQMPNGELCLNEVAPRVHNTGHFSLGGSQTNQFENHLRAITGADLGVTKSAKSFLMFNLLGSKPTQSIAMPKELPPKGGSLKWYMKNELRAGRKMGHLTFVDFDPDELPTLTQEAELWEAKIFNG